MTTAADKPTKTLNAFTVTVNKFFCVNSTGFPTPPESRILTLIGFVKAGSKTNVPVQIRWII